MCLIWYHKNQWTERHWLFFVWSMTWSTYTELFGDPGLYFGAAVTHRAEIAADSCGRHLAHSFLRSRGSMTPITTCLQRMAHNYEDIIYKDGRRGGDTITSALRLLVFLTPDCLWDMRATGVTSESLCHRTGVWVNMQRCHWMEFRRADSYIL